MQGYQGNNMPPPQKYGTDCKNLEIQTRRFSLPSPTEPFRATMEEHAPAAYVASDSSPHSSKIEFSPVSCNLKEAQEQANAALLQFQIKQLQESYTGFQGVAESIKHFFKTRVLELENRYEIAMEEKKHVEALVCFSEDKCQFLEEQMKTIVYNLKTEVEVYKDVARLRKWEYSHKEEFRNGFLLDGAKSDGALTSPTSVEALRYVLSVREKQQEQLASQLHSINNSYMKLLEAQKQCHQSEELLKKEVNSLKLELSREKRWREDAQAQVGQQPPENQSRTGISKYFSPYSKSIPRNNTATPSIGKNKSISAKSPEKSTLESTFDIPAKEFLENFQSEINALFVKYCDEKEQYLKSRSNSSLKQKEKKKT